MVVLQFSKTNINGKKIKEEQKRNETKAKKMREKKKKQNTDLSAIYLMFHYM